MRWSHSWSSGCFQDAAVDGCANATCAPLRNANSIRDIVPCKMLKLSWSGRHGGATHRKASKPDVTSLVKA